MGPDEYFEACQTIRIDILERWGRGYVIEHCLSVFRRTWEERRYRAYVTDTLQMINKNIVQRYGGSYLRNRWADGLAIQKETRTAEEIVADVIKRAGLKLGEKGAEDNGI